MKIRKAKKEDVKEIVDVIKQSILSTHLDVYPEEEIEHKLRIYSEERIQEYLGRGEYFVMIKDGKILGCVLIEGENMKSLYVLPGYMGRGIGSKLAQKAEECIKENGYNYTNIWASLVSEEFYKHRGYKFVKDIEDDNGRVLHKEMRKELV